MSVLTNNEEYAEYRVNRENPSLNIMFYTFGERLFSMMTPQYEKFLMEEIYGLRCIVKFSLDEIMDMPVADRRLFIQLHNKRIENENSSLSSNDTTKEGDLTSVKDMVEKANSKREV